MRTGRILAWQGVIEAAFICMFLIWPLIHELTRGLCLSAAQFAHDGYGLNPRCHHPAFLQLMMN
ncbi:hypothetical protein M440DRAFT_109709 [Trichoderma longibrachiatum ATCC 18648]|uniref:Uncharacterized protein n=1 Tax=Trichoderma longibrachiatum ATCC 18648 TaxID=983965 RepID=A0A2T4BY28_TRILO|nr:hypothetical protein M440DRAFT_109709 [Trichoderma longibrachiatum ATCC 18648]